MATTPTVMEVSCMCCAEVLHCKLKSLTDCVLWCVSAVRELDVASQCVCFEYIVSHCSKSWM